MRGSINPKPIGMCTNFTPTHNECSTRETLGVYVSQLSYATETFPGDVALSPWRMCVALLRAQCHR